MFVVERHTGPTLRRFRHPTHSTGQLSLELPGWFEHGAEVSAVPIPGLLLGPASPGVRCS